VLAHMVFLTSRRGLEQCTSRVYDCDNAANGGGTALPQDPWMEVPTEVSPLPLRRRCDRRL
jgi:hypothetical protein